MSNVFLVQSAGTDVFKKLAKQGVKADNFDCYTPVVTMYVCKSYQTAVNDCRKYNREQTVSRFFVQVASFYK